MVSTFTANKHLEEPAHGDFPGTWDVPVNADWSLIDTAFGGTLSLNATALSGNQALTNVQLQPPTIQISGAPTAAVTYTVPSGVGGVWVVRNTTTGGKLVGIKSLAGGGTVTIPASQQLVVWCDGTATGVLVANSVFDSSGVHFPDGTVQASAYATPVVSNPSGAATIDFTGIAATVNTLDFDVNLTLTTPDTLALQFYDNTATLDTSAVYYSIGTLNNSSTVVAGASGITTSIQIGNYGTTAPLGGSIRISGIQRTTRTLVTINLCGVDETNTVDVALTGGGGRRSAGPITGVRFLCTGGATMTGMISMLQR